METESLGAKFWLVLVGGIIVCGIGALILFLLFGMAWEAWGGLVALIVALLAVMGVAMLVDRAKTKRYEQAGA